MTDIPKELAYEVREALEDATPEAIEWHMVRHPDVPWGRARGNGRYVVYVDSSLTGDCPQCTWRESKMLQATGEEPKECTCGQLGEAAVDTDYGDHIADLADAEYAFWPKGTSILRDAPVVGTQAQYCWLRDTWLFDWHKPGEWPTSEEYTADDVREANLIELRLAREWAADRPGRKAWIDQTMSAIEDAKKTKGD